MNALAEKLAEEALTLPDDARAGLADLLLRSLNPPGREEIDRLWAEEAERRVKEIEEGRFTLLDGHESCRRSVGVTRDETQVPSRCIQRNTMCDFFKARLEDPG